MKGKKSTRCEAGATSNVASGGVLFETKEPVEIGSRVELTIAWPVAIEETFPLNLVLLGTVVRTDEGTAAVKVARYAFQTKGMPIQRQTGAASTSADEVA